MHQPINDSLAEPTELLVARNTAVEIVEGYNPNNAGQNNLSRLQFPANHIRCVFKAI